MAGGALLLASALIWWRLERRTPAIVSGTIAGISVSVAYAAPGWLFLLALGSPVVALVGVGGAILGLASGTGRRSSAGLLGLAATVVALATAAVFGLAPGFGLIAAVGVVVAGGAVATLAVQRAQQASARDPD